MQILGFSSGVTGRSSNVDRMVQAVMKQTGWNTGFAKLTDLSFTGCKGCVRLCAQPQVCKVEDDLFDHYHGIKEADAVVLGSPVYFGSVNATMRAFVERFFGYRHVSNAIAGKPFVLVLAGCGIGDEAPDDFRELLDVFNLNIVGVIYFCSLSPPCLTCGRHQACSIGGLYHMYGEAAHCMKITPDMFKTWEDDPEVVQAIRNAALALKVFEE